MTNFYYKTLLQSPRPYHQPKKSSSLLFLIHILELVFRCDIWSCKLHIEKSGLYEQELVWLSSSLDFSIRKGRVDCINKHQRVNVRTMNFNHEVKVWRCFPGCCSC